MPSALLLILGGDIPGLVAITPASAAAAKSACAMTDLRNPGEAVSLGFGTNARGEVVGPQIVRNAYAHAGVARSPAEKIRASPTLAEG